MKPACRILSDNHWILEHYTQRLTTTEWKEVLRAEADRPIVRGHVRQLTAKKLGYGFVDVTKEPSYETEL